MARDYSLNTTVPTPGIPIGYVDFKGMRLEVQVSEEWRRGWFENVGTALFGPDGSDDVTASIPSGSYLANITGDTTNGLTVGGTLGPGWTATLSLAQNIKTSASPTFVSLTLTNNLIVAGTVDGRDVSADGSKLDGIDSGATANSSDATLLARANHTGTQGWSTITATPTTLSGYGITDAYTKTEVDTAVGGKVTKTTGISDASTAHSLDGTYNQTQLESALNALGSKINEIIDALNA